MYSPHKHSYLQCRSSKVNPRIINRSVNLARNQPTIDTSDLDPPFLRLSSEQPNIPIENVDLTRRSVGYGKLALPKLRRELHSNDASIMIHAINSIMDLVCDPEKGYEAIRLRIPQRMIDLLLSKSEEVRERACMVLTTLAGMADACEMLVKDVKFLENLADVIEDISPVVRIKAATLLEMLTRNWMAVFELATTAYVPALLDNLLDEDEAIVAIHLSSLEKLLHAEGRIFAIEYGALDIFEELLKRSDSKVLCGATNCIAFLATVMYGKELAFNANILIKLNRLLHDERSEVYCAAASAIMYCTLLTKAKLAAKKVKYLPDRLLVLCRNCEHPQARIHSMKALTNLCEHPYIRKKIKQEHLDEVQSIPVHNIPEMKEYKEVLLDLIMSALP